MDSFLENSKRSQRLGAIDIKKKWTAVLIVLLDENFEADGAAALTRLAVPGSKARERGALAVSQFKAIRRLRCYRKSGLVSVAP